MTTIDVLAIFAHRDDAELTCGGTLAKLARQGKRTAILDLTQGEMGSRGSAEIRADEASHAAATLGVTLRENLALPDASISNSHESRRELAAVIRRLKPRIVITHAQQGRHPDHRITAELVRDACFLAGLVKLQPPPSAPATPAAYPAHRPTKILHAISFREDYQKPTFVVDISDDLETKLKAIRCFKSQFEGAVQAGEVYPNGEELTEVVRHHAAHYGTLIRRKYGEPFYTTETMLVDDIASLEVATF
jgi:bacillithiol biosynthesis deacetylase BshB1